MQPTYMRSVSCWGKFTSGSRISASRSDLLKLPTDEAEAVKSKEELLMEQLKEKEEEVKRLHECLEVQKKELEELIEKMKQLERERELRKD